MAISVINVDGTTYPIQDNRISALPLPVSQGGTGAPTVADAKTALSITDTKVAQGATTTNGAYPILISPQTGRSNWTDGTREAKVDPQININPSNSKISVGGSTTGAGVGGGSGYGLYEETAGKYYGALQYYRIGTSSTTGVGALLLGNTTASGTEGNAESRMILYGPSTSCNVITSQASGSNKYNPLPNADGEFVVHTNATQIGSPTNPVYISSDGAATSANVGSSQNWTTFVPYASTSGIMEIGRCLDFHQPLSSVDYDYRLLVTAETTTAYTTTSNFRLYKNESISGGFSIEMPIIGKSGAVGVGNYTTSIPSAAGTTGQIMFVLQG